ncbi:MAG TPA: ABC transporter permease [Thermoplasmata archaeon]|nr:ABC transporter permease [Thermoplasmata archaeon]HEV2429231.1 ABC transporter permease [Thermoplasmata archaeon]
MIRSDPPTPYAPPEGRALWAFTIIGWRWISRNPASAIAPILLPFIFLLFLRLIAPASLFPLEVIGAMLFTTQNVGSWVLGDSATWRIEAGIQDLFVASPMGKVRYLFGIALSNLIPAAPALIVLAGVLAWVDPGISLLAWVVLGTVLFVLWVLFSSIGIAMSSRLRSQREIWPVGNLTFTLLGMMAPLYYPLSYLPPLWQSAARFLPTTYAALLVQGSTGLVPSSGSSMGFDAALLGVSALVGIAIALSIYRWRDR